MFAKVRVGYESGAITCDQPELQLYYLTGPHSVVWIIDEAPPGAVAVMIRWQGESPFDDISMSLDGKRLVATGNRMKRGSFKYSILFFDSERSVIAKLDPVVANEPDPPGWPEDDYP
jgi:hypothetical protein